MRNKLYKAARSGNLSKLKELLEQDNTDINEFHAVHKQRLIDVAAQFKKLDTIKYLYSKGAKLQFEQPQTTPGFLYWVCHDIESHKNETKKILDWLLEDNRYKELGDNIEIEHINAALGINYDNTQKIHGGLSASHYAALVGNRNIKAEELNQTVTEGYLKGATPAWILAQTRRGYLLDKFEEDDVFIDLGATILVSDDNTSHEFYRCSGVSLASYLLYEKEYELLDKSADRNEKIDLNNKMRNGTGTLAWLLAKNKKFQLLKKLSGKSDLVDLSASLNSSTMQESLLLLLAEAKEWSFLSETLKKLLAEKNGPEKFQALFNMYSSHQTINELMLVVFMEYIYLQTIGMQIFSDSDKTLLKKFFKISESVLPTSHFYQKAQAAKADILLELRAHPTEIAVWLVTEPLKETIDNLPLWNRTKDPKNILLILAIDAYQKSGNNERAFSLMLETVTHLEKAMEENQKLKDQIENLKNSSYNQQAVVTPDAKKLGFF